MTPFVVLPEGKRFFNAHNRDNVTINLTIKLHTFGNYSLVNFNYSETGKNLLETQRSKCNAQICTHIFFYYDFFPQLLSILVIWRVELNIGEQHWRHFF